MNIKHILIYFNTVFRKLKPNLMLAKYFLAQTCLKIICRKIYNKDLNKLILTINNAFIFFWF